MTRKLIEQMLAALQSTVDSGDYLSSYGEVAAAIAAARAYLAQPEQSEPVAWQYLLEYGTNIANSLVSKRQLNYPFGVVGSDYLRANDDGVSYVRETPLYTHPAPQPKAPEQLLKEIENKLPGGRRTEWMESMRIADYNEGWNDFRKAARAVLAAQRSKE